MFCRVHARAKIPRFTASRSPSSVDELDWLPSVVAQTKGHPGFALLSGSLDATYYFIADSGKVSLARSKDSSESYLKP